LFADERARLLDLLGSVHADDWSRPTPCPGWSVLGLASHLVGDDLSLLSRHRDDHFGTAPPDGVGPDGFIAWLDALQDQWVQAARRLSPRLVVDLLAWMGPQLLDTMRRRDPSERSAEVSWAGPDAVPVWLDQVRELSEYWIHRQQLLVALGRPADLDAALLGPVLDGFRWAYPYRLGELLGDVGDTVTIVVTGAASATWFLVAGATGWRFADKPGSQTVGRLRMTTDQAWRLLTNNLPPSEQRHLELSGDPRVVEVLRSTRAIIGAPN
jgi:uncharacterized protein (TIGR03083 family)